MTNSAVRVDSAYTAIDNLLDPSINQLAVAVSGGGDSLALLHLVHSWSEVSTKKIYAVTVDHRLRPEAQQESQFVKAVAKNLDLPHETLVWKHNNIHGNIAEAARQARYRLISEWACANGIDTICLGHTQNDQAETMLMQLARKAGVDGLSGIPFKNERYGVKWIRPLLRIKRQELRDYLNTIGSPWIEDPTNYDSKFERIKFRNIVPLLAQAGLTVEALAGSAENLQNSKQIIDDVVLASAQRIVNVTKIGEYVLSAEFWELRHEIQVKLLARMLQFLSNEPKPRRMTSVKNCISQLSENGAATLSKFCVKKCPRGEILVYQNLSNVQSPTAANCLWNGRWLVRGSGLNRLRLEALGNKGFEAIDDTKKEYGRKRLVSSPSLWTKEQQLVATLFENQKTEFEFVDTKGKLRLIEFLKVN
ncbi:MAG: tRNA lysidine(34) synthetase TilS [Rhodobacteraceae bacterium]|nr:tRNA lysidine(34) synthetase TilS [Paracoccaceae bacterium]